MQKDKRKKTVSARKFIYTLLIIIALVSVSIFGFASVLKNRSTKQPEKILTINDLRLNIEVAETSDAQIRGLSGRKFLSRDRGMLFAFQSESEHCFWMKDMNFALDIIWIDTNRKITSIKESTDPDTYPESFCGFGQYVLEINAGLSAKNSLQIGQVVDF